MVIIQCAYVLTGPLLAINNFKTQQNSAINSDSLHHSGMNLFSAPIAVCEKYRSINDINSRVKLAKLPLSIWQYYLYQRILCFVLTQGQCFRLTENFNPCGAFCYGDVDIVHSRLGVKMASTYRSQVCRFGFGRILIANFFLFLHLLKLCHGINFFHDQYVRRV